MKSSAATEMRFAEDQGAGQTPVISTRRTASPPFASTKTIGKLTSALCVAPPKRQGRHHIIRVRAEGNESDSDLMAEFRSLVAAIQPM